MHDCANACVHAESHALVHKVHVYVFICQVCYNANMTKSAVEIPECLDDLTCTNISHTYTNPWIQGEGGELIERRSEGRVQLTLKHKNSHADWTRSSLSFHFLCSACLIVYNRKLHKGC
jgi:hypothetical protein